MSLNSSTSNLAPKRSRSMRAIALAVGAALGVTVVESFTPGLTRVAFAQVAPNPPLNVSALAVSASSVRVSWSPPTPNGATIASYQALVSNGVSVVVPATQTQVVIASLPSGVALQFSVRAIATDGTQSVPVVVPAVTIANTPNPPRNVNATVVGQNRVTLTWQAPVDNNVTIAQYLVTSNIGVNVNLAANQRSVTFNAPDGSSPIFSVIAVSNAGLQSSPTTTGPVALTATPAAPLGVASAVVADDKVRVTWTPPPSSGVLIDRFGVVVNGPNGQVVHNAPSNQGVFFVINLTPGTYTFGVKSIGVNGRESAVVLTNPITLATPVPNAPAAANASVTGSNQVTVNWLAVPATPLRSYLVTASNGLTQEVGPNVLSATFTGLGAGTYTFSVRAVSSNGVQSAPAQTGPVTIIVVTPTVPPPPPPIPPIPPVSPPVVTVNPLPNPQTERIIIEYVPISRKCRRVGHRVRCTIIRKKVYRRIVDGGQRFI